ncbi:MAG: GatB/YqeY domain-containing protein [bacterium]|nr:GatB/YqeY domain-containing protein [bacterium]
MDLKEKIKQDLNAALKERKELEVSVLRQLLAAILNKEKEKRYRIFKEKSKEKTENLVKEDKSSSSPFAAARVADEEIMEVISSEAKKRRESIVEFGKGKRQDLVEKEKKELEILEKYLPEQLSEEEIRKLAKEAIEKTGAKEIKDMGKVMQELMPKTKGRADGSLISKIVKELLLNESSIHFDLQ